MTKAIGSRELKTRLGAYLRQVRAGATILVTDRGEPIAELRPLPTASTAEEKRLSELATTGLLTARSRKELTRRKTPVRVKGRPISETISEDREDRF